MEECYFDLAAQVNNDDACERRGYVTAWTTSVEAVRRGRELEPWKYVFAEKLRRNPSPTYPSGVGVCYGGLGPFDEGTCSK